MTVLCPMTVPWPYLWRPRELHLSAKRTWHIEVHRAIFSKTIFSDNNVELGLEFKPLLRSTRTKRINVDLVCTTLLSRFGRVVVLLDFMDSHILLGLTSHDRSHRFFFLSLPKVNRSSKKDVWACLFLVQSSNSYKQSTREVVQYYSALCTKQRKEDVNAVAKIMISLEFMLHACMIQ